MKLLITLLLCAPLVFGQVYRVENVTGKVKALIGTSEAWVDVQPGMELKPTTMIMTDASSTISVSGESVRFTLRPSAALNVGSIKKMTLDDLLLALALEEILTAPRKEDNGKARNTVIYGAPAAKAVPGNKSLDELGQLKLNGARQLAENGFENSGLVAAKETFRQYPATRTRISDRLYFADLLYSMKLNEEAYTEYNEILKLKVSAEERRVITEKLGEIKKKLSGIN